MKVWEKTPDDRKGWAPLLAEAGREVIIFDWVCNSPAVYRCNTKEFCSVTQKENMTLIRAVIRRVLKPEQKMVFLAWSMGGPQAFKLAADLIPGRTAAILSYAATGPLNSYVLPYVPEPNLNLNRPLQIPLTQLKYLSDSPLFPKTYFKKYQRSYVVPVPPLMAAIQARHPQVKKLWPVLTLKYPQRLPPIFLLNGTRDLFGHPYAKERKLKKWLSRYQPDSTSRYLKNFPHTGMLVRNNTKPIKIYLRWLAKRGL